MADVGHGEALASPSSVVDAAAHPSAPGHRNPLHPVRVSRAAARDASPKFIQIKYLRGKIASGSFRRFGPCNVANCGAVLRGAARLILKVNTVPKQDRRPIPLTLTLSKQ
jgi:hypothetical protein